MREILSILLMLLMVVSLLPLALAEEDVEIDEVTQKEIEVMSTSLGAEIRLLQLERAITVNILKGEKVIAAVEEAGKNESELEAIILEMEALKTEVQETDPNSEDTVNEFVDLKHDATELSKQFRDTARTLLTAEEAQQLRDRIREMDREEPQQIMQQIRERITEFNAGQLKKTFQILRIDDEGLIEKMKNNSIEIREVKAQIREGIKVMTQEEKKEAFADLKDAGIKRGIFSNASIEKAKLNFLVRKETRLTKRLNQFNESEDTEKMQQIQNRITNRLKVINKEEVRTTNKTQKQDKTAIKERLVGGGAE